VHKHFKALFSGLIFIVVLSTTIWLINQKTIRECARMAKKNTELIQRIDSLEKQVRVRKQLIEKLDDSIQTEHQKLRRVKYEYSQKTFQQGD
jgi:hypothetical protein